MNHMFMSHFHGRANCFVISGICDEIFISEQLGFFSVMFLFHVKAMISAF